MRVLVKIGGTLLDDAAARGRLARELAAVRSPGLELVVVHGGGKQMTRFLEEGGVASRFVNGLRVTTPEVVDALLKVFTGSVNKQLVASLVAAGVPAVGISGIDAILLEAEKLDEKLGAVGRPVRCNPELLTVLVEGGFLPVVACVAGDRAGRIFNVNADQMAVACASGFRADRLYFLTDVNGVRDASGTVIPWLSGSDAETLIREQVATGGMQAKLASARQALRDGVREVVIGPGAEPGVIGRLLAGEALGSRIGA